MSYIRFVWFVLQRNSSKETWITRFAENASGQNVLTGITDYAMANNSVVVSGPFKTRKDASKSQQGIVEDCSSQLVRDRKNGEMYDPKQKFTELMNMTETMDMLKRLGKQ